MSIRRPIIAVVIAGALVVIAVLVWVVLRATSSDGAAAELPDRIGDRVALDSPDFAEIGDNPAAADLTKAETKANLYNSERYSRGLGGVDVNTRAYASTDLSSFISVVSMAADVPLLPAATFDDPERTLAAFARIDLLEPAGADGVQCLVQRLDVAPQDDPDDPGGPGEGASSLDTTDPDAGAYVCQRTDSGTTFRIITGTGVSLDDAAEFLDQVLADAE